MCEYWLEPPEAAPSEPVCYFHYAVKIPDDKWFEFDRKISRVSVEYSSSEFYFNDEPDDEGYYHIDGEITEHDLGTIDEIIGNLRLECKEVE